MSDRRTSPPILIYKGDDLAQLAELRQAADLAQRRADEAKESGTARLGDNFGAGEAKAAYDAFVSEAAERAEEVKLQALGRKKWRQLLDAHPPRRELRTIDGAQTEVVHDDDAELNINTATLPEALLTFTEGSGDDLEQTIILPEFPSKEARLKWLDNLSGGDFDKLFYTAFNLNGSMGVDPKLTRYSTDSPDSLATSE